VEIALVYAFGLRQQSNLALGLCPEPLRVIALGVWSRVVDDDLVVQLALADRRSIQAAPALAGVLEAQLELVKGLLRPVVVEPTRASQVCANALNQVVRSTKRCSPMHWVRQLTFDRVLHGQIDPAVSAVDIEHGGQSLPKIRLGRLHPQGMDVRPHEVAV